MNSNPAFKKKAILINPKGCEDGYFEVYYDAFVINKKPILFSEIRQISLRRRFHRQTAFEIFKNSKQAERIVFLFFSALIFGKDQTVSMLFNMFGDQK